MEISQLALARMWLCSFWFGMISGVLYDLLQVLSKLKRTNDAPPWFGRKSAIQLPLLQAPTHSKKKAHLRSFRQIIVDVAFCLIVSILLILLIYQMNNGKFRFPVLLCAAMGLVCYRTTLSRGVRSVLEWGAFILQALVRYAVFFACLPFKAFCRLLYRWVYKMVQARKRRRMRHQRLRYTQKILQNIDALASDLTFQAQDRKKRKT